MLEIVYEAAINNCKDKVFALFLFTHFIICSPLIYMLGYPYSIKKKHCQKNTILIFQLIVIKYITLQST